MELYLQFGHGMKSLTIELSKKWGGITTILSPRDMTPSQLTSWCKDFEKNKVSCLFDPQCYCPKSELKKLSLYSYWDCNLNTNMQSNTTYIEKRITEIKYYNDISNTKAFIVPNILSKYDEEWSKNWLSGSKKLIESTKRIVTDKPIIMTLSFPRDFLMQGEDIIETILTQISEWDVDGFYIIAETPNKQYLVDNPLWLSNVMQICAALKLNGKKVIFGYGNHQLLPLSLIKIDAIASGTWLNVRSFTNRFIASDEQKRKSTWVYHPLALSEYKLSFMDSAYSSGCLNSMRPNNTDFSNQYIEKIYNSSAIPSSTGFNETDAFRHYLCCLKRQISMLDKSTYKETYSTNEVIINTAEREIERLEKCGMYAQTRSFRDIVDVNRAAMQRLNNTRGFALEISWNSL